MSTPELSVIIATRNRSELLLRCLKGLEEQTADPTTYEVIVANDGSDDDTERLPDRLQAPFCLRSLNLPQAGKKSALNAALDIASGPACLFLDDDVIPSPQLIAEHLAAHEGGDLVIGIGRLTQQPPSATDWYAREFASSWNRHLDDLAMRTPIWIDCFGGNFSAPRETLVEAGGFATDIPTGDDIECAFRLRQSGCTPRYLPRAEAVHDDQKPVGRLLADCRKQGAGYVELVERHPEMTPKLLGWFGATTSREQALRRLLIAMRASPRLLAALGRLLPGGGRRQVWFQFVSRFAFWRAVRRNMSRERWVRTTHGVPVLMYHAFGDADEHDRYVVPKRTLARQMRLLSLLRYRVVPFEELARCLRGNELPPPRALAITIDDGYRDNLEVAHPIFARRGFPVTLFLVSRRIGGVNDWTADGALAQRPLLSEDEVVALTERDFELGAHTRNHCSLPDATDEEVAPEIAGSGNDLRQSTGRPINTFAYPYGRYDERAVAAVREADYVGACTVEPRLMGLDDDPVLIPRIEVRAGDSLFRFAVKLLFGGA